MINYDGEKAVWITLSSLMHNNYAIAGCMQIKGGYEIIDNVIQGENNEHYTCTIHACIYSLYNGNNYA